jgi:hypothetical protein
MHRILAITVFFLIAAKSFSQVTIWPKVGTNLSWTTYYRQYGEIANPINIGFYGGVAFDITLNENFSIRPEVIYNQINVSSEWKALNAEGRSSESRRYITIPVNLVRHVKFHSGDLQFSLGGYMSFGLSGGSMNGSTTYHYALYRGHRNMPEIKDPANGDETYNSSGEMIAGKVPLSLEPNRAYYNPMDVGLNSGIAYQWKRFLFSAQFSLGLTNTKPHYEYQYLEDNRGSVVTNNRSISFGLAYRVY